MQTRILFIYAVLCLGIFRGGAQSIDEQFSPFFTQYSFGRTMALQDDGRLLVGAVCNYANGHRQNGLARFFPKYRKKTHPSYKRFRWAKAHPAIFST